MFLLLGLFLQLSNGFLWYYVFFLWLLKLTVQKITGWKIRNLVQIICCIYGIPLLSNRFRHYRIGFNDKDCAFQIFSLFPCWLNGGWKGFSCQLNFGLLLQPSIFFFYFGWRFIFCENFGFISIHNYFEQSKAQFCVRASRRESEWKEKYWSERFILDDILCRCCFFRLKRSMKWFYSHSNFRCSLKLHINLIWVSAILVFFYLPSLASTYKCWTIILMCALFEWLCRLCSGDMHKYVLVFYWSWSSAHGLLYHSILCPFLFLWQTSQEN